MLINKTEQEIMKNWSGTVDNPMVSILTVTFNHDKYIKDALNSFLKQETSFPFEIIVHDDASQDNTKKIVKEYEAKFPHIIKPIYQKENQYSKGITNPACFILPKTKGRYIAVCDGDDYWTGTSKLEQQVTFLEKNKKYSMVYHNSYVVDENSNITVKKRSTNLKDYNQEEMLLGEGFILTNTMMFRNFASSVWKDFSLKYAKMYNGDMALIHKLGFIGECKYMDDVDYAAYRVHSNGVWSSINETTKLQNMYQSKIKIKKNLNSFPKIQKKMSAIISKHFAVSLTRIMKQKDFKNYTKIIKMIINDKELSLITIFKKHISYIANRLVNRVLT